MRKSLTAFCATARVFVQHDHDYTFLCKALVSNQFSNTVTVWSVAADGSLTIVPGSSFPTGIIEPAGMAIDQAGTFLYIASADDLGVLGQIAAFSVSNNGFLTQITGSPFNTGQGKGLRSIAAYPAKTCASKFDLCIQDGSNILKINSETKEYEFMTCSGINLGGAGTITKKGCTLTLQHNASDRRVLAKIDTCQNKATASIRMLSTGITFTITDRNIANNTCSCVE